MVWFQVTDVCYSQEYGDPTLPKLVDMVSEVPDPCKDIILDYLSQHLVGYCLGIHYDVVNPKKEIGCGHLYTDDRYCWTDCFRNYVQRYNIPVPMEFRRHILENYKSRKSRHDEYRLLSRIIITNQLSVDRCYRICIDQSGEIQYRNSVDCRDEVFFKIEPKDAYYIVHRITETLFCYDQPPTVTKPMEGYHWMVAFYNSTKMVYKAEGWPGEPILRYDEMRRMFQFIERETGKDLGSSYMQ